MKLGERFKKIKNENHLSNTLVAHQVNHTRTERLDDKIIHKKVEKKKIDKGKKTILERLGKTVTERLGKTVIERLGKKVTKGSLVTSNGLILGPKPKSRNK